jgi:hypothetical protein
MEAAYAGKLSGDTHSSNPNSDIPEEQTMDEVAALDRKLNASLASFDDMLLEKMDAIRSESAEKMQDLARDAADAAKRLRDKGLDADSSESEAREQNDDRTQKSTDDHDADGAGDATGSETDSRSGSNKGEQGATRENRQRTDYEDDDIVARQLREAAENETDPELKEKLWKEYDEYKKSL